MQTSINGERIENPEVIASRPLSVASDGNVGTRFPAQNLGNDDDGMVRTW